MTIELIPLEGLPEVGPGDDLATLLEPSRAANAANDGHIVAITHKVVSRPRAALFRGRIARRGWNGSRWTSSRAAATS
jgi:F420-0:gamma-glutamyl ligase